MKIGIDLGGTSVRIGLLQENEIVRKVSAPTPSKMPLDESIAYLKSTIAPMISPEIESIGIGVPSVVDVVQGIVYNVMNIPAWEEVHLKKIMEEAFLLPVYVNNDANCFALGEKRFGEGKPFANMLGLTLGTGVGTGVIIRNELYNGSNAGAGEIGCIRYLDQVYEYYCGSAFFTELHNTSGKEAAERAQNQDMDALRIWHEYGLHLGELIKAALFAYDPDAVILGGSIATAYAFFKTGMEKSLQSFPYPKSLERLHIGISSNPDIAILGAAALKE
jgi:glucokinase